MHRQSLGSPAAKLHANGGVLIIQETSSSSSPSSSSSKSSPNQQHKSKKLLDDEDYEKQNKKSHQKTTPSGHPHEKLIHLIPLLTLLCIFILYLNSHDPSQNDLAQFHGFNTLSKPIDSTNIDEIQRVLEIKNGEVLSTGSMRNLQGMDGGRGGGNSKNRLNRKIGDF